MDEVLWPFLEYLDQMFGRQVVKRWLFEVLLETINVRCEAWKTPSQKVGFFFFPFFLWTDVSNTLMIARQEGTARRRFLVKASSGAAFDTLATLNFYFFWWTPFPLSGLGVLPRLTDFGACPWLSSGSEKWKGGGM